MRRLAVVALVSALAGCPRSKAPAVPDVPAPEPDETLEGPAVVRVAPGRWSGGGMSVFVPPGWTGVEGPAPRLMEVHNEATGVSFALWSHADPMDAPRHVPGQDCDFVDRSAHRAVPALGTTHTATCSDDGVTRQIWWAVVEHREVHVEVTTPRGRAIRGRQDTAPLLEDLTLTGPTADQSSVGR